MAEAKTTRTARNKPAAENAEKKAPAIDFASLAVEEAVALPPKQVEARDLPLLPRVQTALDTGKPYRLPNIPADAVKAVDNQLRACGRRLNCKVQVRPVGKENGTFDVYYAASPDKSSRKYTVEDVRAWARSQGVDETLLVPRVRKEVTTAYREAHGLPVRKDR